MVIQTHEPGHFVVTHRGPDKRSATDGEALFMNNSGNDVDLIAGIRARDETALDAAYDRYSPYVYGLCCRILRNEPDAEAVLHDVYWELWSRPGRFNPQRGTLRTYLLTLARSRAIDRLRSDTTRNQRESLGGLERSCDLADRQAQIQPTRHATFTEESRLVKEALENLPPHQRSAVTLSFFDGLSHREIAEAMDQPLGTVKTYIRQGLGRLRQSLPNSCGEGMAK